MVVTSKLMSIGIIICSFGVGFISLYFMGELSKEQKKDYLEEMISQLINLIIFVWVSKVILNISIFISDPLSVLAYPSNSDSFYLAILLSAAFLFYKSSRWQLDTLLFLKSLLFVLVTSSFSYEFIQYIWNDNKFAFGYLIVLTVLLLWFIFAQNHFSPSTSILIIVSIWAIGVAFLLFIQPFVTVFGYIIKLWFLGLLSVVGFSFIFYFKRRRRL